MPSAKLAQGVEELGYDFVAYDHVLGADLSTRPDWRGPYNSESLFHEVFVTFGFVAALTQREIDVLSIAATAVVGVVALVAFLSNRSFQVRDALAKLLDQYDARGFAIPNV